MNEEIIDMSNESDPIVIRFRSLVEILRYLAIFYVVYLSLFLPIVGLILGYIMMKNAVIPENRRLGKICMILGIVFMVLAVICVIIYVIIIIAATTTAGGLLQNLDSGGYY
jgi:hypothetical protein